MSHRPIKDKRAARMHKLLTRKPLTKKIDLVKWLRVRDYAQTAGAARALILAGRLKSDSHTIGITEEPRLSATGEVKTEKVVDRFWPADKAKNLRVVEAS